MKNLPKCTNCWDKGYWTVFEGIRGSDDFGGEAFEEAPKVHKKYCDCMAGKAMRERDLKE